MSPFLSWHTKDLKRFFDACRGKISPENVQVCTLSVSPSVLALTLFL